MTRKEIYELRGCEILDYQPPLKEGKTPVIQHVLLAAFWVWVGFGVYFLGLAPWRLLLYRWAAAMYAILGFFLWLGAGLSAPEPAKPQTFTLRFTGNLSADALLRLTANYDMEDLGEGTWRATNKNKNEPEDEITLENSEHTDTE